MKSGEIQNKIDQLRGEFIGKTSYNELLLGMVLSNYMSPKKSRKKLRYNRFIFTKLDIGTKMELYRQILNDNEPTFVKYSYPELLSDIKAMQEVRNLFAHSLADIFFLGYKDHVPVYSDRVSFRNAKNMEKDFFTNEVRGYDLTKMDENLKILDKIRNSLFDVMYYYNRVSPLKKWASAPSR